MKKYIASRLIKSEDLNHHGTLFAGRMAEWFIEGSFIAAAMLYGNPENIVCVKMHGLKFSGPATKGDIITLTTRVAYAGTTSITVYGRVNKNDEESILVEGYVTFVCVDENGKKMPHKLVLPEPESENEARIREIARTLR
jgi:acyl-CoA hydrolase